MQFIGRFSFAAGVAVHVASIVLHFTWSASAAGSTGRLAFHVELQPLFGMPG